ncbi:MAG: membrane protein insertase YidC [Nitrospinota bacterium]|nr:membrane protein insertase YidC [Nitrospinota bacterium]
MLDRNFIISLVMAFALIFLYNAYYQVRFGQYLEQEGQKQMLAAEQKKKNAHAPEQKKTAGTASDLGKGTSVDENAAPVSPETTEFLPSHAAMEMETAAAAAPPSAGSAPASADLITINTGAATVVLSSKGAILKSYHLNGYHNKDNNPAELILDPQVFEQTQKKNFEEAKADGDDADFKWVTAYPTLGLKFPKEEFSRIINTRVFSHDASGANIDISGASRPTTVTFELSDPSGIRIRKIFTFHSGENEFDFSVEVISAPQWGKFKYSVVWFGLNDDEPAHLQYLSYHRPMLKIGKQFRMDSPDEEKRIQEYKGDIVWAAFTHKYYAVIGMPQRSDASLVRTNYIDGYNTTLEWEYPTDSVNSIRFFLGPKRHDILREYSDDQRVIIDYGWFNVIAQPLFWLLDKFHSVLGNWGWAIVMLTVLTKVVLFPLSQKGFRSMKKLQKFQPQMKKLQELYKDDKEKLNRELMAFYKENKVNPMGGCLPMFLQIPIFFALYKVLYESIELKGVPWILWITDLTAQDPYYVTPVIMGGTMFLQQWMTPSTGDQTQRQIMLIMPVVFTFMFLSFPSGLILYWMVNNILSIIQQWIINRENFEESGPKEKTA